MTNEWEQLVNPKSSVLTSISLFLAHIYHFFFWYLKDTKFFSSSFDQVSLLVLTRKPIYFLLSEEPLKSQVNSLQFPCGPLAFFFFFPHDILRYARFPRKKKKILTPVWGDFSVHRGCLIQAVIQYPHIIPSGPINVQSMLTISKHSIQAGRINLEPSKATASKHWSLHVARVQVRVWGRIRVGWCLLT